MHKSNSALIIRNIVRVVWLSLLLACIMFYFYYRDEFTAAFITAWIKDHTHALVIVYSFICIIRGLTLIPATPFIFAGIMLFPQSPLLLFLISMGCILLSSTLIYYGSSYMGFGEYFEKRHSGQIDKLRERLGRPSGFYFIAGWSLLPFTPTDLVVYVAGTIKLSYQKTILPLMLGEGVICGVYIFNGVKLMQYI